MFGRLHHIAYRCRDAQRTVDFYTRVVGLKYVAGLMPPENNKPTWPLNEPGQPPRKVVGEQADSIHIFFELGDGSYLAFFDVPGGGDDSVDPTPWWVKHIAFEVKDMNALLEGKKRLEAHGVQVLGPKDHGPVAPLLFVRMPVSNWSRPPNAAGGLPRNVNVRLPGLVDSRITRPALSISGETLTTRKLSTRVQTSKSPLRWPNVK